MTISLRQQNYYIHRRELIFILFCLVPLWANAGALEQLFAPRAELQEVWLAHDDSATKTISHRLWADFLRNNLQQGNDGIHRIAYATVTAADRDSLRLYLKAMQDIAISTYSRQEQLAYWINLYNAATVNVVLKHYPVATIRDIDISPGFFSDGPWGKQLLTVEGRDISLNDIEHGILRPVWKDPRIHYAVNCASISCPNLAAEPYESTRIDQQLDNAARQYIAHPRAVHLSDDGPVVSSIYSWFQDDFGETEKDVLEHIQRYAPSDLAEKLQPFEFFANDEYDWALNDATVVKN